MIPLYTSLALALGAGSIADDVTVTARMARGKLAAGEELSFTVDLELAKGLSASEAGIPAPFLQLDVPEGVKLAGPYVTSFEQLKRNEFVMEPYERLLKELPATVRFTLEGDVERGAKFGINVTGYLHRTRGDEAEVTFLRRRLELPLKSGAKAREVRATTSTWGPGDGLLQIGDEATPFEALRPDGSTFDLGSLLGERRVIVTTYRAYW